MTVKQLSKALGLSEKTIKIRLTLLKKEGIIVRVGNNRTGYWEVVGYMEDWCLGLIKANNQLIKD